MKTDDNNPNPEQVRKTLKTGLSDHLVGNGPIILPPKRTRKANEAYPLKLTEQQRESLLHFTQLKRPIKEKIEHAGEGTQIVLVTRNELDDLNDEIGQAAVYAPAPDKKRLLAVLRRAAVLFEDVEDSASLAVTRASGGQRTSRTSVSLYQFKITLLDIKPAIWRRIQVPDCTLADLHEYIQAAFGWENYHLHRFDIHGEQYGPPAPDGGDLGMDFKDETEVLLSKLLPRSIRKARWIYEYDFGDGWRHEVVFEGFPPNDPKAKYPLCIEGERACPPEDCGGPWGYADFVVAITNPRNKRHEELLEWSGPFDPEAFDPKKATKEMRK